MVLSFFPNFEVFLAVHFNSMNGISNLVCSAGFFTISRMSGGLQTNLGLISSGLSLSFMSVALTPLHRFFDQRNVNQQLASKCLMCFQKALHLTACAQIFAGFLWKFPKSRVSVQVLKEKISPQKGSWGHLN